MIRIQSVLVLSLIALGACASSTDLQSEPQATKNVVLFLGDGMGISTVTAARIFDGQSRGESGEENFLSFEKFPHIALIKTYNSNQQVPDSAGTASAIHTGTKTRAGVISIGPEAHRRNCQEALAHRLPTIGELAKRRGKALGIVTTTRVTDATPATVYAHSPERYWESDKYLSDENVAAGCIDIATQLVRFDEGGGFDIVLGGGAQEFLGSANGGQRRASEDDLIQDWLSSGERRRTVRTKQELGRIAPGEQVLGLFSPSHMTLMAERDSHTVEPTLTEMTVAAIEQLNAQQGGYYLLVEGGRIDDGHHHGKPGYALLETQEFSRAIAAALQNINLKDTLVLVTADHSHGLTLSGYPTRGNDILGHVVENDLAGDAQTSPFLAADGKPYTTVGYANGPGAVMTADRPMPDVGIGAIAQSSIAISRIRIDGTVSTKATHSGEDVALYSIGSNANLVAGVIEQDKIFDIIVSAFGW